MMNRVQKITNKPKNKYIAPTRSFTLSPASQLDLPEQAFNLCAPKTLNIMPASNTPTEPSPKATVSLKRKRHMVVRRNAEYGVPRAVTFYNGATTPHHGHRYRRSWSFWQQSREVVVATWPSRQSFITHKSEGDFLHWQAFNSFAVHLSGCDVLFHTAHIRDSYEGGNHWELILFGRASLSIYTFLQSHEDFQRQKFFLYYLARCTDARQTSAGPIKW